MANNKGLHHSKAYLRKRLHIDKKTPDEIALECGVTVAIIYRKMKEFGLK